MADNFPPVLRLRSRKDAETAIDCLIQAGFKTVELTLTTTGYRAVAPLPRPEAVRQLVNRG